MALIAPFPRKKLKFFFIYDSKDQNLFEQLECHLTYLKDYYDFSILSNSQINAGNSREKTIEIFLNSADLILLLISANFTASSHCNKEMQYALERYNRKEAMVVSVLLRPVYVKDAPFTRLRILPENELPITKWDDEDEAYVNISTSINEIILRLIRRFLISQKTEEKWIEEEYTYFGLKRYKDYIHTSNEAILLDPNNAAAYSKKGWALCELRNFKDAIPVLEKAIDLDPKDAMAYLNKGWALYEVELFEDAVSVLEKAIDLNPKNAIAYLIKGRSYYKLKRLKEAISDLEQAVSLDPYLDMAYLIKSQALYEVKRFKEAISDLKVAIKINPDNALAFLTKDQALRQLKRFKETIPDLEQAISLDPRLDLTYLIKDHPLRQLKSFEDANLIFENALLNHHVSRRAIMIGAAGVIGVAGVGGLVWWAFLRTSWISSSQHLLISRSSLHFTPPPTPLGTLLYRYLGHTDPVDTVAWSPDGQRIASGSSDKTLQVWHAE